MDGYEEIAGELSAVAAGYDADSQRVIVACSSRNGRGEAHLNPGQLGALIAMLQRMQARQRGQG